MSKAELKLGLVKLETLTSSLTFLTTVPASYKAENVVLVLLGTPLSIARMALLLCYGMEAINPDVSKHGRRAAVSRQPQQHPRCVVILRAQRPLTILYFYMASININFKNLKSLKICGCSTKLYKALISLN